MNKQQERDIHLIGLALFLALSAAVQPHSDVQPHTLSDEALQTTRNHRRRTARRRRGLRPDGLAPTPDGHDSRQRPLGLRPVSDLLRQRAGRHRLFEIE